MLATSTVCKLANIPTTDLENWVRGGIIAPLVPGGRGRGKTAKYSTMQAVGLVVGNQIYRSERGCVLAYVGKVVAAFESMTEQELKAKLFGRNPQTHLITIHQGKPLLGGPQYPHWIDVKAAYMTVRGEVASEAASKLNAPEEASVVGR